MGPLVHDGHGVGVGSRSHHQDMRRAKVHRLTPASTVRSAIERLPDTRWMSNLKDTHACIRSWVRCAQRAVIAPPPLAAPGTDETDTRMALPHKKALTTTPPAYIKDEHRRPTPRQHQETARRKTVQKLQHNHTALEAQTWTYDKAASDNQNQTLKQHV